MQRTGWTKATNATNIQLGLCRRCQGVNFFFLSGCHHDVIPLFVAYFKGTRADNPYSEFPSLSNNSQLNNANPASMWSSGASRNLSGPIQRNQSTPVSSQQGGQDDLFASGSSRLPLHQTSFRFGNQGNMATASQGQPSSVDDFPPLNRAGNGEIGSDRSGNLMSLAFGSQQGASGAQRGNGLLNALSANSRANDVRSPPGVGES